VLRVLKFLDTSLEMGGDRFVEELGSRLAFTIVVLAEVLLFGTNTLLTGGLCTVTALVSG
jgi:hypothetical protein